MQQDRLPYASSSSSSPSSATSNKRRAPLNVVFMGMGEPLLNYKNVLAASRALLGSEPDRRVTISTVGVAPRIIQLAHDAPPGLRLALSLHAPNQALREKLLPKASRLWPMPELLHSMRQYEAKTKQGILLEYILLCGLNDEESHAEELAALIRNEKLICAGVNLIPYNPTEAGSIAGYQSPSDARCKAFRARLRNLGVPNVTIRFSTKQGRSIAAACGQLGLRHIGQRRN